MFLSVATLVWVRFAFLRELLLVVVLVCFLEERVVQRVLVLMRRREEAQRIGVLELVGVRCRGNIWGGISHWVRGCWKSVLEMRIGRHLLHVRILADNRHWCKWDIMSPSHTTVLNRWIDMNQAWVSGNESLVRSSMLLIVWFLIKLIFDRFLHCTMNYVLAGKVIFGASIWLKLIPVVRRPLN